MIKLRRSGKRGALGDHRAHQWLDPERLKSSRMLVRDDGSIAGTIGGGCVEAEVWAAAKEVRNEEAPRKMTFSLNNEANYDNGVICGGTLEIFVEPILPQPMLYIFGGGHVLDCARNYGTHGRVCHRRVIDDRESFANRERFPMAEQIHTTFEDAFAKIKPNASTYMVIVTRGHKDDMRVLAWALSTSPRYIGMIGSKRKVLSVYRALEKDGVAPEKFAGVHAPVGLDIGALTPEEIAISITAELIAIRRHWRQERSAQDRASGEKTQFPARRRLQLL